jgi:hypothetical protein
MDWAGMQPWTPHFGLFCNSFLAFLIKNAIHFKHFHQAVGLNLPRNLCLPRKCRQFGHKLGNSPCFGQ